MRNHKITVEEKLQDSNACASNRAMPGGISRVGWRTFGECLREKVIAISAETPLHSHRVENVVINSAIKRSPVASKNLPNDSAAGLGTMTKVNIPLLIPDVVYREASSSRDRRRKVGSAKGAKAILCPRADVRIARIHRRTDGAEHHVSGEVSLIEHV